MIMIKQLIQKSFSEQYPDDWRRLCDKLYPKDGIPEKRAPKAPIPSKWYFRHNTGKFPRIKKLASKLSTYSKTELTYGIIRLYRELRHEIYLYRWETTINDKWLSNCLYYIKQLEQTVIKQRTITEDRDMTLEIGKNTVSLQIFKLRIGYILRVESKNNVELIALQED